MCPLMRAALSANVPHRGCSTPQSLSMDFAPTVGQSLDSDEAHPAPLVSSDPSDARSPGQSVRAIASSCSWGCADAPRFAAPGRGATPSLRFGPHTRCVCLSPSSDSVVLLPLSEIGTPQRPMCRPRSVGERRRSRVFLGAVPQPATRSAGGHTDRQGTCGRGREAVLC